jgi:pilus assembly protein CpaD
MTRAFRLPLLAAAVLASLSTAGCMRDEHDNVSSYPDDYRQRHPIVVTRKTASVPHECGQWPDDLGASNISVTQENAPHWNYGCATQANLAAMIDNPNDLLEPRRQTPANSVQRQRAVTAYSLGQSAETSRASLPALTSVTSTGK